MPIFIFIGMDTEVHSSKYIGLGDMVLLIYAPKGNRAGERLIKTIGQLFPNQERETCNSIFDLKERLRRPVFDPTIAVLLASSNEDFQEILSMREQLENTRIVLIVPDTNPVTLSKGHMLRPRFMCDCNNDFIDVMAVLNTMIRNSGHQNQKLFQHLK
jgi:hypothetical protein